ncbi:MAG: hypothetical protein ACK5G7_00555 [Erysipelotrichaceae bacterium]
MKKAITYILIIIQVFMLVGCSDEATLEKFDNAIISSNFERTLNSYYYEDNGSIALTIYTFSDEISPIITVALQNLLEKKNIDIEQLSEKQNPYYFSILKSIYSKENNIDIKLLTDKSNEYDFFLAFNTATLLNDEKCISELKEIYLANKIENDSFAENIYREINNKFVVSKNKSSLDSDNKKYLANIAIDLKFDFNVIIELEACLNYLNEFNVEFNKNDLQSIYNSLSTDDNQMFMLSQTDILTSQYINCINIINKLLKPNVSLADSFYEKYEAESKLCYKGLNFEIGSVKNLALYLTGLHYSLDSDNEILYNQLLTFINQIDSSINKEDATSLFYYNYICQKLNMNGSSFSDEVDKTLNENKIIEIYFKLKNNGETLGRIDLSTYDELSKLLYLDVCHDKEYISESLVDFEIWDLKDAKEFPFMLNLYTAVLLKNNLLADDSIKNINEYIESQENIYGYKGLADNYDMEASVYYTNIINMIESGYDSGLR